MFGLNMYSCAVRSINNHAGAVAFYERCPLKRGHDHGDERRIKGKESSKQMSVRIRKNGDVAFKYHNTDVVTWRPDNSYVVDSYSSRSTCEFANCFLPGSHFLTKECSRLHIGGWSIGTVYPISDTATVHGEHVKSDAVFTRDVVDRVGAKEVLARTRYAEYRDWHNVMFPMVRNDLPRSGERAWFSPQQTLELLEDADRWHDLMMGKQGTPPHIREMLYHDDRATAYTTMQETSLPAAKINNTWSTRRG